MVAIGKTISVLWQDYLFLTTEIEKFLDQQDLDMFYELLSQRERLQTMIEERQQQGIAEAPPAPGMLAEIDKVNQVVMNKLRQVMNREGKQQNISRAYDGYGSRSISMGLDWKS